MDHPVRIQLLLHHLHFYVTDRGLRIRRSAISDKANSPSVSLVDPGTSADIDVQYLVVPEVILLEAPPATNPSTTPVTDAVQTPELSITPSLHQDADDQILGEHQVMAVDQNLVSDQQLEDVEASIATHTVVLSEDTDSLSSDAANVGDTGEAATTVDADEARLPSYTSIFSISSTTIGRVISSNFRYLRYTSRNG